MKLVLVCSAFFAFSIGNVKAQDYKEWDDYFMPGVGYKVYVPKNQKDLGVYQGVETEFVIYARAKGSTSYKSGPSRVKTYGNLGILKSDKAGAKDLFSGILGLNLSFESKTDRKFGLPYFGLETGGIFQRDFSTF